MTIKEIAKESGYGVGTVSRVLNNSPNVSEAAREKITAVLEAHHFQPNTNARHLKLQTQYGIAIIVKGIQNMLFGSILEKMQAQIEKKGFASVLYYVDQDGDEVTEALQICREKKPYGIIFLGSNFDPEDLRLKKLDVPCITVTTNAASLNLVTMSSISLDDSGAAYFVMDYLYKRGHQEIGVIGGDPGMSQPSLLRLNGCQIFCIEHGLPFDRERNYAYARFSLEGGYLATEKLLNDYPAMTAIFAMSDMMAIGAIRCLYDHGKRVPQDVSVFGFDGIELAGYTHPKLTTIRQNAERLSDRGVEILLYCIDHPGNAIHEIVPYELQEGSSVKTIGE